MLVTSFVVDFDVGALLPDSGPRAALLWGLLVAANLLLWWITVGRRSREARGVPYESYFENGIDAVAEVDPKGVVRRVNRQLLDETGFPVEALVGRTFRELAIEPHQPTLDTMISSIARGTRRRAEVRIRRAGGQFMDVAVHSIPIQEGDAVIGAYQVVRDLTERKRTEQDLEKRALHDYLTGLPNRLLFSDRLRHALDRSQRDGNSVALLYIDLDRFKPVNDRDGHQVGDELLRIIATRLNGAIRGGDSVARLGGDEFAVILESSGDAPDAMAMAQRILAAIRTPAEIEGKEQQVGASIGIAISSAETEGPEELVRQADLAMYEAKARGGFGVELYRPRIEGLQQQQKLLLEGDLRLALAKDQLSLQYQPILDTEQMKVVAFEVLVRWTHPEHGPLLPSTFIPIAEESSLVAEVDRWVLERACRDVRDLMDEGEFDDSVYLSINLSGRHFAEADIIDAISGIILDTGFDPESLQLEITESAAGGDLTKVRRLRALGVKVAIDDFGTGYSSLSYVRDLDVDVLKVDKSFVLGLGADPSAVAIVRTIITLADMLGLGVIVEGIEDARQLEKLHELGGHLIQGYLFGRPMDLEELPEFLRAEVMIPEYQPPPRADDGASVALEPEPDDDTPRSTRDIVRDALRSRPRPRTDEAEGSEVKPFWPV